MNLRFVGTPPDLLPDDQLDVAEQVLVGDTVVFERVGPNLVRLRKLGTFERGIYTGPTFILEVSKVPGSLDIRAL
ncbi:MAG: hypothetical protein IAE99_09185 [Rhodothermales bacterium]|nr:hypothetical protein [Rhodothermales bacterium]MCA0269762.1 hypothetical protein [Bacteroidota bacterium]